MKRNKKKICKYPLSDDMLDTLETDIERLNETKNLSEKISIHRKVNKITTHLENEVATMILKLDEINNMNESNTCDETDIPDIDAEIINIESMIKKMESCETIQDKIHEYEKIVKCIRKCKHSDNKPNMTVSTCN
jgi:hypothetical protein